MSAERQRPAPSRRYSAFVGIAFLLLLVVATLNTIRTLAGFQGQSVLEDRPIALDSGRVGWLMTIGTRDRTTTSVYDTRRGYFFAINSIRNSEAHGFGNGRMC